MKESKKHLTIVQVVLVSFVLVGCSSVTTTREPTVRDVIGEVINDNDMAGEPSMALVGRSSDNLPVQRNSVWTSRKIVKEPSVQEVQGYDLQANDVPDTKSAYKPQFNQRDTKRPKRLKVNSKKHRTVLVSDALDEVFGGRNTARKSTVMEAVADVIAASEMSDDENNTEEPSSE